MPARSSSDCTVPSSPLPPCIARNTRSTSARSGADTTVGKLETAFLSGGRRSILPANKPLLVGAVEPPAARVVRDDLVPATTQSADDLRSAGDRDVALHAIAPEQHRDLQRRTSRALEARELYSNVSAAFRDGALVLRRYILVDRGMRISGGDMRSIRRLTTRFSGGRCIHQRLRRRLLGHPAPITFTPPPRRPAPDSSRSTLRPSTSSRIPTISTTRRARGSRCP